MRDGGEAPLTAHAELVGSARRQSQPSSVEEDEADGAAESTAAAAEGATAAADELPVQPQMMSMTPRSRLSPERAEKTGTERSSEALRAKRGSSVSITAAEVAQTEAQRELYALADAERTALGRPSLHRKAVGEVGDEELGAAVAARRPRRALRRVEPLRARGRVESVVLERREREGSPRRTIAFERATTKSVLLAATPHGP